MAGIDMITERPTSVIVVNGDQLLTRAWEGETTEEGHNRLRLGITESRDLPMLQSLHSRLYMSTADGVEIATPETDILDLPDDARHRTNNNSAAVKPLSEKTDGCH